MKNLIEAVSAEDSLWDVDDAASFLKVSKSWIYQASASGTLPCIRIGALIRFEPGALRSWLRGETAGTVVRLPGCR
jgi:excisionase family DNA binding protein